MPFVKPVVATEVQGKVGPLDHEILSENLVGCFRINCGYFLFAILLFRVASMS